MFSQYIVWYLFLAGAGSGAFVLASVFNYAGRFSSHDDLKEYQEIAKGGLALGPALVLFAALFLIFDLGAPEKAYTLFLSPHLTLLTLGSWLIVLFLVFSAANLFMRSTPAFVVPLALETLAGILALICAFGIIVYTGVLLSSMPSIPFLNTPLLVALFMASALSTGAAVITLYGFLNQRRKAILFSMRLIPRLDIAFIVVEVLVLAALLFSMFRGNAAAQTSVQRLLFGELAPLFWTGAVGAGMLLPVVIGVFEYRQLRAPLLAASALLLLVGGYALRYCIVGAGEQFDPAQYLVFALVLY